MVSSHTGQGGPRKAAILTALPVEYQAAREHLRDCQEDVHPQGTVYERGRFPGEHEDWDILLVELGEGNSRTSMEVERAIQFFEPEVILFVGVAGGLKDVSIGDVVFAPKIYGYESGKESPDFEPRPDVGESSYMLEQRARAVARKANWLKRIQPSPPSEEVRARPGPIVSGEKIIASTASVEYQRIRKQYGDALAVEKEGRGFLVSVRANRGVEALVIRAISDLIDGKAEADASGSQELASRHASAFAFELLSTFRRPGVAATGVRLLEAKQGLGEQVWTVPYLRNPSFTGRDALLQQIRTSLLSAPFQPSLVALYGLGGVGKTQLTVEYAFRHTQGTAGYTHVLWVRADGPAVLAASYAALADALDVPEKTSVEQAVKHDAVRYWLQQNTGWLLVFDNAEQISVLQPYLPTRGSGHILITSRNPSWGELAVSLAVDVLERAESIAFLLKRTGQMDEAAALSLAEALGDLPLALAQAAAYIEQTQKSLTDYRALFERRYEVLLSRPGAPAGYSHTVAAAWELSFEQVRTQSPAGAALLALCAFLAPSPLSLSLLSEGAKTLPEPLTAIMADELILDEAIGALRRYSLVQVVHQQLLFHRLVQAVMRDRLGEERSRWAEASLRLANAVFEFNDNDLQTWARCAERLPHVLAACENARSLGVSDDTTGSLLMELGSFLHSQAEYAQACDVFAWGIELARQRFGPGSGPEVRLLEGLGVAHMELGQYAKTQEYLDQALSIIQAAPEQEDLATSAHGVHFSLAHFLIAKGDLRQAREHAEQAVALEEATGSSSGGGYVGLLGNILLRQGRFADARNCFERALKVAETELPPEHPSVAAARTHLAMALDKLGQYRQAEELLDQQLAILQEVYGPKHPVVATLLKTLGGTCQHLGNLTKARECCERALHIDEERLGPTHLEVAIDLNNLARVLHEMGDLREARRGYERAIAIDEQLFGPEYSGLAILLDNLGRVEDDLGEFTLARTHFERALALHEREHGSEHHDVANVCNNLGMLLARKGKLTEARPYLERALATDERVYGAAHPEVATDLTNLAEVLLLQGEHERGVELLKRALAIRQAQDPQSDEALAFIFLQLGKAAFERSDLPTAKVWLEHALQVQDRFEPESGDAVVIRLRLGKTLYLLGQGAAAIPLLERARALAGDRLDAFARLDLLLSLGGSLRAAGNPQEAKPLLEEARALAELSGGISHLCMITFELARVAQLEERLDEARRHFEQVLQLAVTEEHKGTRMRAFKELGLILEEQGDLPASHHSLSQALEMGDRLLGPDSLGMANIAMHLGRVALKEGQASRARQYLERALAICQQPDKSDLVAQKAILPLLGHACTQTGDRAQSAAYARQFLGAVKATVPPDPYEISEAHLVLGMFLLDAGREQGARAEFQDALRLADQLAGEDAAHPVKMRLELGQRLLNRGVLHDAQEYFTQALRAAESLLGARDEHVAEASVHLGHLLSMADDLTGARTCFERAVEVLEAIESKETLAIAAILYELAEVLLRQGLRDQALEKLSRAESLCQEGPPVSALYLQVLMTRGDTYLKAGQWQKAREDFERAIHHQDCSRLPPEKQASLYNSLGVSLIRLEQPTPALDHLEKALEFLGHSLGKEHPGCASTLFNLGTALEKSGKHQEALERYQHALAILVEQAPAHPLTGKLRELVEKLKPLSR